jgi:hypothetical protein
VKSEADNLVFEAEKDSEIEELEVYADVLDTCVTEITNALQGD